VLASGAFMVPVRHTLNILPITENKPKMPAIYFANQDVKLGKWKKN